MPLSIVQQGRKVKLVCVDQCEGLAGRLAALGLVPGVEFEIVKSAPGPLILAVGETRLMIGRGMAEKIRVA